MTIEINRANSPYIYRTNPINPRIIDRRKNKHGARWEWFRLCQSDEEARAALLKLEKKDAKP